MPTAAHITTWKCVTTTPCTEQCLYASWKPETHETHGRCASKHMKRLVKRCLARLVSSICPPVAFGWTPDPVLCCRCLCYSDLVNVRNRGLSMEWTTTMVEKKRERHKPRTNHFFSLTSPDPPPTQNISIRYPTGPCSSAQPLSMRSPLLLNPWWLKARLSKSLSEALARPVSNNRVNTHAVMSPGVSVGLRAPIWLRQDEVACLKTSTKSWDHN